MFTEFVCLLVGWSLHSRYNGWREEGQNMDGIPSPPPYRGGVLSSSVSGRRRVTNAQGTYSRLCGALGDRRPGGRGPGVSI